LKQNRQLAYAISVALGTCVHGVHAQDADQTAATSEGGIAEVVVTAQRRSESIQNVPITVQSITTTLDTTHYPAPPANCTSPTYLTLPRFSGSFTVAASGTAAMPTSAGSPVELLDSHEVLRRVIEYRDSLQQLWSGSGANPARAVAQLREWCSHAEASGIRALRDFAQGLPGYARS